MNTKFVAGVALALLVAACGQGTSGAQARLADVGGECGEVQADDGPGAGTAGSHGQAQRSDGDVQISQEGSDVVARQLVSIANDFGGAGNGNVTLTTTNGDVLDCVRGNGGYRTNVHLEGRGSTEQEARAALASMSVAHSDMLTAGTLRLSTVVQFNNAGSTSGGISLPPIIGTGSSGGSGNLRRSASIVAGLPSAPSYAFNDSTTNGDVIAAGFSGSDAKLSTTEGDIGLDGDWGQSTLSTSDGDIAAQLHTSQSGSHNVSTTNGDIDVALAISGTPGFDLSASTTNGAANIDVAGTDPVGEQTATSAHRQSPGYSGSAVKISVGADSTNGDVTIHD